ncbi:MAG: hypothetical protein WEE51_13560, partial [Pirellulaceae bacterium]
MSRNVFGRHLMLLVGLLLAGWSGGAQAQSDDAVLLELYGRGVHTFHRHDFQGAHKLLSDAIDLGSRDPRAYYFRGLALMEMGRPEQAEADFQAGAQLETESVQTYSIGQALERVQGPARLKLEVFREQVRLEHYVQRKAIERQRYEQLRRAEEDVIRQPRTAPSAPRSVPVPDTDESDPFGDATPGQAPADPAPLPPTAPADAEEDDPFGGAPMPEAPPATPAPSDDPFADDPAAPAMDDPFADDPAPATPP